jgi:hypothetical protein
LDFELWERMGWGLAAADAEPVLATLLPEVRDSGERRRIALHHLRRSLERARQFNAALDQPAPHPPEHLGLLLTAGDAVPTARTLAVDSRSGRLGVVDRAPGDGRVLRSSALLDER